jgi:purine-nucleoside phosphorylase
MPFYYLLFSSCAINLQNVTFLSGIAGNHPLRGLNDDDIGPRFPAVSDAYDGELQEIVVKCAKELGIEV